MMYKPKLIEGARIEKTFFGVDRTCVRVDIPTTQYELCVKASKNFWSSSKPGEYGAGLKKDAELNGFLGCMAFGMVTGLPVDLKYRKFGDTHDFLLGNIKIDVKCAFSNYGKCMLYCCNEWGKPVPINKDIFVLSYSRIEKEQKQASVVLIGYNLKEDVLKYPKRIGIKGKGHLNYELEFSKSKPIIHLIEKIKKRLEKSNVQ